MSGEELRAALDILDVIDGIVDDTHPEGHGCPLCVALTDLRAALAAPSTPEPSGEHCRGCEADADLARRAHRAAPSTEPALDALRDAVIRAAIDLNIVTADKGDGDPLSALDDAIQALPLAEYARLAESR